MTQHNHEHLFVSGGPVVYAPQARHYDLVDGMAAHVSASPCLMRCYRIIRSFPARDARDALVETTQLEGWPSHVAPLWGHMPLELFPLREPVCDAWQIRAIDCVTIGPWELGIWLGESEESARFQGNRQSLALNGLRPGVVYRVAKWAVPNRAITLEGVTGTYCTELFEPVRHASRGAGTRRLGSVEKLTRPAPGT